MGAPCSGVSRNGPRASGASGSRVIVGEIFMRLALPRLSGFLLVGLLGAVLPGQLAWETDLDAALAKAKKLSKPTLWVVMMDGEVACERMLESVYTDPRVIAKTGSFVLLPCSKDFHVPVTVERGGKKVETCPQFVGCACEQHRRIEQAMRSRFAESNGKVIAPQHVITAPDGSVLIRKRYELSADGLLELMARGLNAWKVQKDGGSATADDAAKADKAPAASDAPVAREPGPNAVRLLKVIRKAKIDEKKEATEELLELSDDAANTALVDLLEGSKLRSAKARAAVIRAAGKDAFSSAASAFVRLLGTKQKHLRNCVVVTLEEMADPAVSKDLLKLWETERDPEIRKDILRALGPAGAGDEEARKLLLAELSGKKRTHRVAAAMALGPHLSGNEDVRTALQQRFAKAGRSTSLKLAIIYAYQQSKDSELARDLPRLVAKEKNAQIRELAEIVSARLEGRRPKIAGGGRGGRGARGAYRRAYRTLGPLFEKDKIERNAVREIRERWGRGRR